MKFILLVVESQKQEWNEQVVELYRQKINQVKSDFEVHKIKSPKLDRDEKALKILKEGEIILRFIKNDDFVFILDEQGKELDSLKFADQLKVTIESNKKRIVFIIGGAFGLSGEVKKRAQQIVSLSRMTMNHLVAQTVLLEQIYRGLTILKGIPYHNG